MTERNASGHARIAHPVAVDGVPPHFSMSRRCAGMLFVSGQLPFGPDGRVCGGDIAAQTRVCLNNIESILAAEGLGRASIAKATVWLKRKDDFGAFNKAYAAFFDGQPPPARSAVVADLVVDGAMVEIEVVAELSDDRA